MRHCSALLVASGLLACRGETDVPSDTARNLQPLMLSAPANVEPVAYGGGEISAVDLAVGPRGGMVVYHHYSQVRCASTTLDGQPALSHAVSGPYDGLGFMTPMDERVVPLQDHFLVSYDFYGFLRPPVTRELSDDAGAGPPALHGVPIVTDLTLASTSDGGAVLLWSEFPNVRAARVPGTRPDGGDQVVTLIAGTSAHAPHAAWAPDGRGLLVYTDNGSIRASRLADLTPLDPGGIALVTDPTARTSDVAWSTGGFLVAWVQQESRVVGVTVQHDGGVSAATVFADIGDAGLGVLISKVNAAEPPFVTYSTFFHQHRAFADGGDEHFLDAGTLPVLRPVDGGYLGAWLSQDQVVYLGQFDGALRLRAAPTALPSPLEETSPLAAFVDGAYELDWLREHTFTPAGLAEPRSKRIEVTGVAGSAAPLNAPTFPRALAAAGPTRIATDARGVVIGDRSGTAAVVIPPDGGCIFNVLAAGVGQFAAVGFGGGSSCVQRFSLDGAPLDPQPLPLDLTSAFAAWDGQRYALAGSVYYPDGGFSLAVRYLGLTGGLDAGEVSVSDLPAFPTTLAAGGFEVLLGWTDVQDGGGWVGWLGADGGRRLQALGNERVAAAVFDGTAFQLATTPTDPGFSSVELPPASIPLSLRTHSGGALSAPTVLADGVMPTLAAGPAGEVLLAYTAYDPTPGIERLRVSYRFLGVVPDAGANADAGAADAGPLDGGEADAGERDGGMNGGPGSPQLLRVGCGCSASLAGWLWPLLLWPLARRARRKMPRGRPTCPSRFPRTS